MDIAGRPPDPSPRKIGVATTAFAVAGIGIAVAVWAFFGSTTPGSEALQANGPIVFLGRGLQSSIGVDNTEIYAFDTENGITLNLTNSSVEEGQPAWSRLGRAVAFTRTSFEESASGLSAHRGIFVMDSSGSREIRECGDGLCGEHDVALSPDGESMAFVRSGSIFVSDTKSGQTRRICGPEICSRSAAELAWSPDGSKIVFAESAPQHGRGLPPSSIFVVDIQGGALPDSTNPRCSDIYDGTCPSDYSPQWSPDGKTIAFNRVGRGQGRTTAVYLMRSDGSDVKRLAKCMDRCQFIWGPDGTQLALIEFLQPSIRLVRTTDGSETIIDACLAESCRDIREVAWSPDGEQIAFLAVEGPELEVYVANVDGTGSKRINTRDSSGCCLVWLPDTPDVAALMSSAKQAALPVLSSPNPSDAATGVLAFMGDPSGGNEDENEIFTARADGTELTQLTNTPLYIGNFTPSWSSDGTKIYFERADFHGEQPSGLFIMDPDGKNQLRVGPSFVGDLSPDANRIAYLEQKGNLRGRLFVMNLDGSGKRLVASPGAGESYSSPVWSPDGSKILLEVYGKKDANLSVADADGTGFQQLTNLPGTETNAGWSPDGSQIVFVWRTFVQDDLYVVNSDGSGLRRLTDFGGQVGSPAWSPDGNTIAFFGGNLLKSDDYHNGIYTIRIDGSGLFQVTPSGNTVFTAPAWQPLG